jgi:5-methylcytosine-specific restriction endonuclease McrA
MAIRICNKCGGEKPLTTEYYNQLSAGSWRGTCKACMAANTRRHYHKDPSKVIARVKLYNEQKQAAGGECSDHDRHRMRAAQGDRCGYCGTPLHGSGEWDHMTSVSQGGDSSAANVILACRECNRDKNGKSAQAFVAWRRRLGRPVRADFWPSA